MQINKRENMNVFVSPSFGLAPKMGRPRFRLRSPGPGDKLTPELGFRVGFRVRISSWIFELDF